MIVLGLVQTSRAQLFQECLAGTASVLLSTSGSAFASLLLRGPVDVAVVDPVAGAQDVVLNEAHPAALALAKVPHVPFLLYVTGPMQSFAHTHSLLQLRPTGLIMRGEETPATLISVVRQAAEKSLPRRILTHVAKQMETLPSDMQRVLQSVFEDPDVTEKVDDLCIAAGVTRRTFDRRLLTAGLASGQAFLEAGRVAKAYALLQLDGARCDYVVREMEYSSSRRLQDDSNSVLEMPPTAMRRLSVERFAARVGTALIRKGGGGEPRRQVQRLPDDVSTMHQDGVG